MIKHLQVALTQDGVTEDPIGSNGGKQVDEYLKSVGLGTGYAWCGAFVYWCCKEAYGENNPLIKTGGVLNQWNKTPKNRKSKTPSVGDAFVMDFGKGKGHIGFVYEIIGDQILTIEGNAADMSGTREGTSVCIKTRKISACKGFININPIIV